MVFTRIQRGAARALALAKHNLLSLTRPSRSLAQRVRTLGLGLLALRIVVLPVPMLASSPTNEALAAGNDGDPLSYTQAVPPLATGESLDVALRGPVLVIRNQPTLADLTIGQSPAEARAAAAVLAAAEQARQAEIAQQQAAAAAAEQIRLAQAAYVAPTPVAVAATDVVSIAHQLTAAAFGEDQWPAMQRLIMMESGFNPNARNPYSGACGLAQALPCSKLPDFSVTGQMRWMIGYVQDRYGTPNNALSFHYAVGWY